MLDALMKKGDMDIRLGYSLDLSSHEFLVGLAIWVRIRLFDSIWSELNGFVFEKIDSFNKLANSIWFVN